MCPVHTPADEGLIVIALPFTTDIWVDTLFTPPRTKVLLSLPCPSPRTFGSVPCPTPPRTKVLLSLPCPSPRTFGKIPCPHPRGRRSYCHCLALHHGHLAMCPVHTPADEGLIVIALPFTTDIWVDTLFTPPRTKVLLSLPCPSPRTFGSVPCPTPPRTKVLLSLPCPSPRTFGKIPCPHPRGRSGGFCQHGEDCTSASIVSRSEMPEEKRPSDVEQNYDVEEIGSQDSTFEAAEEDKEAANKELNYNVAGIGDHGSTFEGPQNEIAGRSTNGSNQTKKAVPAFLAAAAKEIGEKVVSKLGDRIAEGVVENHQEKVVNGLQDYLGNQMDKFDDQYKDLLKDTSGLAAGLNRQVEEADIQLLPKAGATMGNMYAPPGWEIRHKYKYKDDRDEDKGSFSGQTAAFTYPVGLGPVLMNGCFGTGYKNGDPCWKAKIPRTGCPNMIDGATYLGVGFDGRGVYSSESRKKSVIQRSCEKLQTYGKNEVPDSMTLQGIYDTNVESYTFSSTEEYRQYLAEKSAVTSAKAMFQEEINKASGHGAGGGLFGIGWSVGGGRSSQSGTSSQSSDSSASSSASAQLSEQHTQTYMAMLEINIFRRTFSLFNYTMGNMYAPPGWEICHKYKYKDDRYAIFMDDVTPDQLNVGFLRDFISLPESYFSPGAELIFQNFYLRWGTHYIKSAKFGGQLKIIKTKQATKDLSMSEFATKAERDWKMTMSTFSALATQTKSSSWWHEHETKTESKQATGQVDAGSESQANRGQQKQESAQEYSNEMLEVQGGDQKIAAAITEMYTTALTTELKDWLESINDYPKPFSFVLRPVPDLLDIPFATLFPAGEVDYGCFGKRDLKMEEGTGRKYYTQTTTKQVSDDKAAKNNGETVTVSEIRYCNFADRKALEDSMTKKRLSLGRAVTVYLEEGRLLSSDFLLPAGEAGCETAMLAFLQGDNTGVPTWEDMIGGKEFTVVFDMPYDIPGILQAQDVLELKFFRHKWFSYRRGFVPHLYDGYKNGGSNDLQQKKVSVQGLVMTYSEETGVFTVTDDDFEASAPIVQDLPDWIKGREVARAEFKKLLSHLSKKTDTVGDVPCSIHWSNAHRFDPTNGGKCIHFTAASEGDIFVVFASIPQNHETWVYIQISPEGVVLYKAMRLRTKNMEVNAGGLGSATLYQSYFVCLTEDVENETTVIQYGKTPDNEERPHVWLRSEIPEVASLRYYSFGSGESPVKVMGVSLLNSPAKDLDFVDFVCREGNEMINGICQQKCHPECKGCRTSGSNLPTDCIACKHLRVSSPFIEGPANAIKCVAQCPLHMELVPGEESCKCIKEMEEARADGVVDCVAECPLTHFDDNNVCKKCSSLCTDLSNNGKRVCSGPTSADCDTCKYKRDGLCVNGCSPGQKAVKGEDETLSCHQCQPGHECKLGDEREDICPAGKYSNENRTACEPCPAGEFSGTPEADSCTKCPAGKYSTGGGSTECSVCVSGKYSAGEGLTRCLVCPAGTYSNDNRTTCEPCAVGEFSTPEAASCQKCQAGEFSSTPGAASCQKCPAGAFSSTPGAASCQKCPAGEFSSTPGAASCQKCPSEEFSGTPGAASCQKCPTGQTSLPGSAYCSAYISLGCWRDTSDRAIPELETTDPRLDGDYTSRDNAIGKCYQVAHSRGFPMFAVQHNGQCFGSANGLNTYKKYGPSTTCASDGEGGPWGNEVYKIKGQTLINGVRVYSMTII
uniref:MACPF domain-containing protein n=1 Tax=Branchiostoma floridae TaxID=7739 RepID=C3ZSC8_BRAFL|eukprot:XP_002588547.1 hypothetical protein BRAFLDRAFT_122359 [Branchiostoma floridae]